MRKSYHLLLGLLVVFNIQLKSQSGISGYIKVDTSFWTPIAYLSLIPDFDDMNTMVPEMILESSPIDNTGRFMFKTQYFPEEDNLFRIHISKKNDPPASLIIGGKDENHFFFIANKNSQIIIRDTNNDNFLTGLLIEGYNPNKLLRQVDEIAGYLDTTSFDASAIKMEFIRSAIFEKLRYFADTCSNPLVSLYAIYKSKFERDYLVNQQFYKKFLEKWGKENSTYFNEFRSKISFPKEQVRTFPFLIAGIFLLIGFLVSLAYIKLFMKNRNPLHNLSVQERKIFALLLEGKSNKEISEIMMIGLSTVKSHVNNIYSKLDINSRKDLMNLNLDIK